MTKWLEYLKSGLSRQAPNDQISAPVKPKAPKEALKSLVPFVKPYWRIGLIAACLIIFSSVLAFPQPMINRFLIDDVILGKRMDLLPWGILLFAGMKVISISASMVEQYFLLDFEQRVTLSFKKALLGHTLELPKAFFDKQEVGYLISRISSDVGGLSWFFSNTIVYLFTNMVRFIGGLIFLFYLEWRLALACIVVLPVLVFSVKVFSKRMHSLSHYGMEQQATIMKRLQETITSIPLIKAFSTEKQESNRVSEALEEGRQLNMERTIVSNVSGMAIRFAPELSKAIVFVVGAYLAIKGEWTLGSLMAFQSYMGYVFSPAMYFANANLSLQNSLASLERVMGLFDSAPEDNLETGISPGSIEGAIKFKDVSFSYGGEDYVLEDISFQIHPGEHVAIVGPSGVGKTTLISLILCFYKVTKGEIRFDDIPLADYNLPSIRRRIGYVSQSTLLLSGSFNDNLRYGNPDATQEEVEKATKAAGIYDFIAGLPNGFDSKIDERAVNLSEGQKQRLSIARALIKNPDVLILDEPTSSLDSIVEQSIFAALPEFVKHKTLIIVAHRLSTIQNSDCILLLNEKRLIASGTHQELLESNAFYRELVSNQQLLGMEIEPEDHKPS